MPASLTPDERAAWRALMRMSFQLAGELGHALGASTTLSYQDYLVLAVLEERPDGRLRPVDLGRELGWEKSRLSHHVSRMVDRGLVRREQVDTDKRGALVVLTASGRRAVAAAEPVHAEVVRRHFLDVVSERELATISRIAARVLGRLTEPG